MSTARSAFNRVVTLVSLLGLVASMMVLLAVPAMATDTPTADATAGPTTPDVTSQSVDVSVTVGNNGSTTNAGLAPIECKWELVDIDKPFFGDSQVGGTNVNPTASFGAIGRQVGQLASYRINYAWLDASDNMYWYDDVREDMTNGVPKVDDITDVAPAADFPFPCSATTPTADTEWAGDPAAQYRVENVIQVYANAGDAPDDGGDGVHGTLGTTNDVPAETDNSALDPIGERVIELWAAVDAPTGASPDEIEQVYWDIYHPDGTVKAQVHDFDGFGKSTCDNAYNTWGYGKYENPAGSGQFSLGLKAENSMLGAAIGTLQVSENAAASMLDACSQLKKKLFRSHFTLSKHQPCGAYRVEANSVSSGGDEDQMVNYFSVLCFVHLDLDFTSLPFDPINVNDVGLIDGDTVMNTADGKPTAINAGSAGMRLSVEFDELDNGAGKYLTKFDAKFGIDSSVLVDACDPASGGCDTIIDVTPGGPTVVAPFLGGNPERYATLCANETGKFVWSIHTTSSNTGSFSGTWKVLGMPDSDLSPYSGPQVGAPWTTYTDGNGDNFQCNNDKGIWGGYHILTDGIAEGGGPNGLPAPRIAFDDDYGRNQRLVDNQ